MAGISAERLVRIVGALVGLDVVRMGGVHRLRPGGATLAAGDAAAAAVQAETRRLAAERSRVEQVGAYALTSGCRRAFILAAFGQPYQPPRGACDRCHAGDGAVPITDPEAAALEARLPIGTRVNHVTRGIGTVERYEPGAITVRFGSVGHRRLATDLVADGELLHRLPAGPEDAAA